MTHEIAVIPGDGIGPTVTHAVEPLFRDLSAEYDFEFTTTQYD
jgi:tartrate dehydrogenase/decarboxylase/D-malate dehydrogenase